MPDALTDEQEPPTPTHTANLEYVCEPRALMAWVFATAEIPLRPTVACYMKDRVGAYESHEHDLYSTLWFMKAKVGLDTLYKQWK